MGASSNAGISAKLDGVSGSHKKDARHIDTTLEFKDISTIKKMAK